MILQKGRSPEPQFRHLSKRVVGASLCLQKPAYPLQQTGAQSPIASRTSCITYVLLHEQRRDAFRSHLSNNFAEQATAERKAGKVKPEPVVQTLSEI